MKRPTVRCPRVDCNDGLLTPDLACPACRGSGRVPADLPVHAETVQHLYRRSDPSTSRAAARGAKVKESHRIVRTLLTLRPMTADEIEQQADLERIPISPERVSTALAELARQGVISLTGEKRRTRRGRPARVWRLSDAAEEVA